MRVNDKRRQTGMEYSKRIVETVGECVMVRRRPMCSEKGQERDKRGTNDFPMVDLRHRPVHVLLVCDLK